METKIVYTTEAVDAGMGAEEDLYIILKNELGVDEFTIKEEKSGKKFDGVMFRKTTKEEDHGGKGDFVFYNPETDEYVHVDLTIARDHKVLGYKRKNEIKKNLRLLQLSKNTLKYARLGGTNYLEKVVDRIVKAIS